MKTLNSAEFLALVWPTTLLRNETLELRAIKRKDGTISRKFFTSANEFLVAAQKFGSGWDIYYGVSTRFERGGKKTDCFRVKTVWVDFDKIAKLPEFKVKPDVVVSSGAGFHVYWLLDSPVFLRTGKWAEVEAVNRGLMEKLGGDPMAIDIARILRVPDFFNHKYDPVRKVVAHAL